MQECGTANFGDARLTQRLVSLVANLAEHPENSLPEALGSRQPIVSLTMRR